MNEKIFLRLLRTAAWITVAGVAMGAWLEWSALIGAWRSTDPAERARLGDAAIGIGVFWGMLWISLPIGALAFWRHIGWLERVPALLLPLTMLAGILCVLGCI